MGCKDCIHYTGCMAFLKTAYPEYKKQEGKSEAEFIKAVFEHCTGKVIK